MEELSLGELIKQKRKELGLTQVALSESVDCSVDYIIKLEQNKRYPSKEVAETLAGILNLPFEQLWSMTQKIKLERLDLKHKIKKEKLSKQVIQPDDIDQESEKMLEEAFSYLKKIFSGNDNDKKLRVLKYLQGE